MAVLISAGSFLQALLSAHIIRTYSTPLVFRTVQDVFIFLIPAGLLACLIGSTIGVATLTILGGLAKDLIFPVWLTFWLGDTVGVYVMTSLIMIWVLQPHEVYFKDHIPSFVIMILLFLLFSLISYFFGFLPHLFLPISIWAAYLFRMQGASLAIFMMTAASILLASYYGYEGTSLISLISFIGITIAASLTIAAVVNEREYAFALLNSRNVYLEKQVDVKVEVLEHIRSGIADKKPSGALSKLVAIRINSLLNDIDLSMKETTETLTEIQNVIPFEKFHQIDKNLSEIVKTRKIIGEVIENLTN